MCSEKRISRRSGRWIIVSAGKAAGTSGRKILKQDGGQFFCQYGGDLCRALVGEVAHVVVIEAILGHESCEIDQRQAPGCGQGAGDVIVLFKHCPKQFTIERCVVGPCRYQLEVGACQAILSFAA